MLQFVPCENFWQGNPRIQMEYGDFPMESLEVHPELGIFNVRTYAVFQKKLSVDMAYKHVNAFLATLDIDIQRNIANAITLMNAYILDDEHTDVNDVLDYCAPLLDILDKDTNLCDRIEKYTRANIVISDMSDAGSHPQDRVDLTFVQEEAVVITAIMVLCKLISPVIGSFIHKYSVYVGNKNKENYACAIFRDLFERKYRELVNKIMHYVTRLVTNKSRDDAVIHCKGFTPQSTARCITSNLFTKKSVSIDLDRPDGNVIKYIASCIKSHVESQQKSGNVATLIKMFDDPKDGETTAAVEESNNSRIETESKPSRKPADCIPIAKMAAQWAVKKTIEEYNFDIDRLTEVLKWYKDNPTVVNPITTYIVSSYYGPDICGGKSVYLLDASLTAQLAAVLQMAAMESGCIHLAHVLTMTCSMDDRVSTLEDFKFTTAWRASPEYAECRKCISSAFGMVTWDSKLKDVVAMLTQKNYIYHTAPAIWEMQETKNLNGTVFTEYLPFMLELMVLIRKLWVKRSLTDVPEDYQATAV